MLTISLQVDNLANAKMLTAMLSRLDFVKSVNLETDLTQSTKKKSKLKTANVVSEPAEPYNWTSPSRPATDEEFELMIAECEAEFDAGNFLSASEAQEKTKQAIENWKIKSK